MLRGQYKNVGQTLGSKKTQPREIELVSNQSRLFLLPLPVLLRQLLLMLDMELELQELLWVFSSKGRYMVEEAMGDRCLQYSLPHCFLFMLKS